MTSKYTHCYSNYVNHILNTSPTKVAYTFSKGERFSSPKKEKNAPVDQFIQKTIHPDPSNKYLFQVPQVITFSPPKLLHSYVAPERQSFFTNKKKSKSNLKKQNLSRSITPNKKLSLIDNYVQDQIFRINQNKHVSKSKSANRLTGRVPPKTQASPFQASDSKKSNQQKKKIWQKGEEQSKEKRFNNNYLYSQARRNNPFQYTNMLNESNDIMNNRYLKYSPYYRHHVVNTTEDGVTSKQRAKLKRSLSQKSKSQYRRQKTTTNVLQQLDHPSKNITIHGYYPIGTEINPNGKYPVSTYKNVPSHSFGDLKYNDRGESPGKLDKKRRSKEGKPDHTQSSRNLPKSYQTYLPFSEFGYVSPFEC